MITIKNVLITGASSGIGKSLSLAYANRNHRLFLLGRSKERLGEIGDLCLKQGAEVHVFPIDVSNRLEMQKLLTDICSNYSLDLVIAGAGVSSNSLGQDISQDDKIYQIFDINFIGVLNTILPILPFMIEKKYGQLAVISSLAGIVSFSNSAAYSTSKMAINCFVNSIRPTLKNNGIAISLILPGYVDTPMTQKNNFNMPLKITPDKAAEIIKNGLNKRKKLIIFPKFIFIFLKLLSFMPNIFLDKINLMLIKKK